MKIMGHHGKGDNDIEYRITEVEKSASIDEEKVKKELYDALRDKKKVIEDLREQLAFRNSALEHELNQRQVLEDDRRNLVLRLERALCTQSDAILSTEETQTPSAPHCSAHSQTEPAKRVMTRAAYTQTWDPVELATSTSSKNDHLAGNIKKLQDKLNDMRKEQLAIEKSYEKRLKDLQLGHVRATETMNHAHFEQEKMLGDTVLKLQEEVARLRDELSQNNALLRSSGTISEYDSDEFNGSGFCCAPGVTKRKKKKKKPKSKGEHLPNPYGLHTSEKQSAFWSENRNKYIGAASQI